MNILLYPTEVHFKMKLKTGIYYFLSFIILPAINCLLLPYLSKSANQTFSDTFEWQVLKQASTIIGILIGVTCAFFSIYYYHYIMKTYHGLTLVFPIIYLIYQDRKMITVNTYSSIYIAMYIFLILLCFWHLRKRIFRLFKPQD